MYSKLLDEIPTKPEWDCLPAFSFAFQPIVAPRTGETCSYEALIRGPQGEPAPTVLNAINDADAHIFADAVCSKAIHLAKLLGVDCQININCLPSNFLDDQRTMECVLKACETSGFPLSNVVLEVTENELIRSHEEFLRAIRTFRKAGVQIAIDDFGAGHSGLNLLADFQPDTLKVDLHLIRDIHILGPKQSIIRGIKETCNDLGIDLLVEGIETVEEYQWCANNGIELYQGYLFAKPGFETLPSVSFPTIQNKAA